MIYIERGMADVIVAGGAEATITPLGIGGFCAARALSERNDAPEKASRPFDKGRDGFVPGEGSGSWCSRSTSTPGSAAPASTPSWSATAPARDAYHITSPAPEGEGGQRAMRMALARRRARAPSRSATSTPTAPRRPQGDVAECQAIGKVFGDHARKGLMVSSTKSMTGHLPRRRGRGSRRSSRS